MAAGGPTNGSNSAQRAAQAAFEALKRQAEAQERVNKGLGEYLKTLQDIGNLNKTITHLTRARAAEVTKLNAAMAAGDVAAQAAATETIQLLDEEVAKLSQVRDAYAQVAREANKASLAGKFVMDGLKKLPALFSKGYGRVKGYGLFDMDKSMKSAALEMGLLSKQTQGFRTNITNSTLGVGKLGDSTIELGVGIEDLAKMQAEYSSELGRMVTFTSSGNEAMAELAKGTVLGAEGAASLAAEMDTFGKSAETTKDFIEQTMNDAHKMGLNASKVVKNIQSNIKLLNKYNFKGGSKGLASMAQSATKMGVSMDMVAGMADKLFDIEGAVEMSAQLQVLGGEWSKLADPFKLMYMARNDMDGLFKSVVNATKGAAQFNKETGDFDIPALELHRLRKIAEQTGLSFDDLATAAKKAAKFSKIDGQFSLQTDDDTKEFISNIANIGKDGKATIDINGDTKFLSALNDTDIVRLKAIKDEKASLKERARTAQTFDDALTNTINLFKSSMLPVVEDINEVLSPLVKEMFANKSFKEDLKNLGMRIGNFVKGATSIIKTVGDVAIALGPTGMLATVVLGGVLFEAAKWYANGIALGSGFQTVAGGTGVGSALTGGLRASGGGSAMRGLGIAGGLGAAGMLGNMITDNTTDAGSTGNIIGKTISDGLTGAAIGSFLGPIGMAIGGVIGVAYGGITAANSGVNDGIFNSPVHDGAFPGLDSGSKNGLGSDFSKKRGIIQGGKITPIDNKDDLIAAKPDGVIDRVTNSSGTSGSVDINFGELKFSGSIMLELPGNDLSVDISKDLLKNQDFLRNITKMVHIEASKAINGGKISGQPA